MSEADVTEQVARREIHGTTNAAEATAGLYDDRGNYDASGNTFPAAGGSGDEGAILKGDVWTVIVGGTLGTIPVVANDTVRARVDTPGQTAGNWTINKASQNLTKADVGLSNVDNTPDDNKPISADQQNAFDRVKIQSLVIPCSDRTTDLDNSGDPVVCMSFRMPYAFELSADRPVKASVVATSADVDLLINIKKSGNTIFNDPGVDLHITKNNLTTVNDGLPDLIDDPTSFLPDELITIEYSTTGAGWKGLQVTFIGFIPAA